jgi:hypothetical protein
MTALFKKLNFKEQNTIVIVNAPASFDIELAEMKNHITIVSKLAKVKSIEFILVFVTMQAEIDIVVKEIDVKLNGDAIVWFCYPKGTSKKYKCDFNRDTGWASVAKLNFEPVRQVAIDEDWSALRFRKVEYIKTITRREDYALTAEAKNRTTQKN